MAAGRRGKANCECCGNAFNLRNSDSDTHCQACYDLAGMENYLTDNGKEEFLLTYRNAVISEFENRPDLKKEFPKLAKLVSVDPNSLESFLGEEISKIEHDRYAIAITFESGRVLCVNPTIELRQEDTEYIGILNYSELKSEIVTQTVTKNIPLK